MNNDQTVQWAILGCTRIAATTMFPEFKGSANGNVPTVASRKLEKAKAYTARFEIPQAYGSIAPHEVVSFSFLKTRKRDGF